MTREEKVKYWLDIVAEDLDLGEFLFKSGRWLYSAFMCHQVVEKMLKAYWTATRDDVPPYIHEHKRLAELCGLYGQMDDRQRSFLNEIRLMNIEARYPDTNAPWQPRSTRTEPDILLNKPNRCSNGYSESAYKR